MKTIIDAKTENPSEFPYAVTRGNSTVKIYRVKGAKNRNGCCYQVCDLTGAKRKLISFADFGKAKAEAERIAKKVKAGDLIALAMGGTERASYGRAMELLKDTETPLELAVAHYAEAFRILGGDKLVEAALFYVARHPELAGVKTVPEMVKEMIEIKSGRDMARRSLESLKSRLGRFARDFPGKLVDVDTRAIQKWLDGLTNTRGKKAKGTPLGNQSRNHYRADVHSLFVFAERRGFIGRGTNPVEFVDKLKVRPKPTEIFTPSEFAALLNVADSDHLPALAIGGFAGLRPAEIQRLEWSEVHLDGNNPRIEVTAGKAKTPTRRTVPVCDALAAWLKTSTRRTGPVWEGTDDNLTDAQNRAAKLAGVKWPKDVLRHSYGSYRACVIGDIARTCFELGNTSAVFHKHYHAFVSPEEAKAWFSIMPPAK